MKQESRLSQIFSNAPSQERDELSRLIGPSLIAEIESLTEELQFLEDITIEYQKDQNATRPLTSLSGKESFNRSMLERKIKLMLEKLAQVSHAKETGFDKREDQEILTYMSIQDDVLKRQKSSDDYLNCGQLDFRPSSVLDSDPREATQFGGYIDDIRSLLIEEKYNLIAKIERRRTLLEGGLNSKIQEKQAPSIADLKNFSDRLEYQIRGLEKRQELESLLENTSGLSKDQEKKTRSKNETRHAHSAPVPSTQPKHDDLQDLFNQFSLLETPIEMPTRPIPPSSQPIQSPRKIILGRSSSEPQVIPHSKSDPISFHQITSMDMSRVKVKPPSSKLPIKGSPRRRLYVRNLEPITTFGSP